MTRILQCVVWVGFALSVGCSTGSLTGELLGPGPGPVRGGDNEQSPMGTNLSGIRDYSVEIPFVDLFKSSRTWISGSGGTWDDGRALDVDDSGWVRSLQPGQIARTLMLTDVDHYLGGRYIVLYEGQGEIQYDLGSADRYVQEESVAGRHVLALNPGPDSRGIQLAITATDPRDPIRNIRVLLPGGTCEGDSFEWCDEATTPCAAGRCVPFEDNYETQLFNPQFLQTIGRYSVLRFMDWMETNNSTMSRWDDRPKLTDARWREDGAPVEMMVALAHRVGAEPWFTLPHLADDDYVRRFAEQVHDLLDPSLRAWVEYSNEVWNSQFSQNAEVAAACANGQQQDSTYSAALICYSERTVQVLRLWDEVFGEGSPRVMGILGAQAANPWSSEQVAGHQDAHGYADAIAVAPYFGVIATGENEQHVMSMSTAALLEQTEQELLPEVASSMREQAAVAEEFGLKLVSYEGGQHFVGTYGVENNEDINALYDEINRHPRMRDLYRTYLDSWRDAGGELFVHYTNCDSYTKWGRFGLLEYLTQPLDQAPKYDAVQTYITDNPRWWPFEAR